MRQCSLLCVCRSVDTSDTVLRADFIMISTAVHMLLVRCALSATACPCVACVTTDKVSSRVPINPRTLRAMPCCFCCVLAACALGLLSPASH